MADHLSDQEQLEAIKKWWQRNGTALVLVIVLVAGGWYGWGFWQKRQQAEAEEASMVFIAMLDAVSAWERDPGEEQAGVVSAHAETLKKLAPGSQYARYGALTIARLAMEEEDYSNAAAELRWALDEAKDDAMKALVRLRLAAVEFAREDHEEALSLLAQAHPPQFAALYSELKGDILADRGDAAEARDAYRTAAEQLDDADQQAQALLELKINEVTSLSDVTTAAGEDEA